MTPRVKLAEWIWNGSLVDGLTELLEALKKDKLVSSTEMDAVLGCSESDQPKEFLTLLKTKEDIEVPDVCSAGWIVSEYYLSLIVSGDIPPHIGAYRIWEDILSSNDDNCMFERLEALEGPIFQYDDFDGDTQKMYYGDKYCNKKKREYEREIIDEAKNILKVRGETGAAPS